MNFECSICGYISDTKKSVIRHFNRKVKCGDGVPHIINKVVNIKCEYCNVSFTIEDNMKRHLKICKVKKNNLEKELSVKNEENKILKEKLAIAEALAAKSSITNNNTNNIQQQNNLIINLTAYNDPNLKGMEKYYLDAIKKAFMSVPYLIEKIHFNVSYPENQNIAIKNNRTKVAKVYDGAKWKSIDENDLIDEIINTYEQLLENYAEDDPDNMKHIERYKQIKERDSEELVLKDLKDEIKKLMYDNRNMVKIKN